MGYIGSRVVPAGRQGLGAQPTASLVVSYSFPALTLNFTWASDNLQALEAKGLDKRGLRPLRQVCVHGTYKRCVDSIRRCVAWESHPSVFTNLLVVSWE